MPIVAIGQYMEVRKCIKTKKKVFAHLAIFILNYTLTLGCQKQPVRFGEKQVTDKKLLTKGVINRNMIDSRYRKVTEEREVNYDLM